jgi:GTP-binding protein
VGGRGTDARLEQSSRIGADERKAARKARKSAFDEDVEHDWATDDEDAGG